MERSNSGVLILLIFVLFAAYMLPLFPGPDSEIELTNWATTVALVETNSLNIKSVEESAGIEIRGPVEKIDGGRYSTRPPGMSMLAAPFYALTRMIIGGPNSGNLVTSWYVLRLLFGVLPLLVLGVWLYSRDVDSYSLAVLLFATPILPYSLLFYSHVFAAILVYMAFRMIYDGRRVLPETCFKASLMLGVAIACEYTAAVPTLVFGLGLFFTERVDRLRRLLFFISGLVPALTAVCIYNYLVFGSPIASLFYIELAPPSFEAIYLYLLSPSRGILVFSPVLLLGAIALLGSNERGTVRHSIKTATILVTFVALSGIALKFDGNSVGPRHLILIVPLLLDSFFDGEIEEYASFPRGLIFAASIVMCTLPVLTYPFATPELQFPHNSFWMPLLLSGSAYAPTLANKFGYAVSIWTMLPAIIAILSVPSLLWRDAKYPVRFGLGTLLGFALVAGYLFLMPLETGTAKPHILEAQRILSTNRLAK